MKKNYFITLLTLVLTFSAFSQVTFDFKTAQDPLGWVKAGGAQAATIVADGLAISWTDAGNKIPKLKQTDANIDASKYKIIAFTVINNSSEVKRLRTLHFKGDSGTDPSSGAGSNTRYTNIDIITSATSEIYYFNLTHPEWVNYNAASNDDTDSDMDHISILLTTATNGGLNVASTAGDLIIEKIEFLESIPSTPRNDFTFNDTSDAEGFSGANGVTLTQPVAGEINLEITNASQFPKFEQTGVYSVDADAFKGVEITLINNSPKNRLSFVSPSGTSEFISKEMNTNDPNPQTIKLDLKLATNWTGVQKNWWLQLIENPGDGAVASAASIQIQQILFVDEVLSAVDIQKEDLGISIYPNPVINSFKILSPLKIEKVEIFNVLGQKSSIQNLKSNTVDVSTLSKGIYILKVYQENAKVTTKKFIKK